MQSHSRCFLNVCICIVCVYVFCFWIKIRAFYATIDIILPISHFQWFKRLSTPWILQYLDNLSEMIKIIQFWNRMTQFPTWNIPKHSRLLMHNLTRECQSACSVFARRVYVRVCWRFPCFPSLQKTDLSNVGGFGLWSGNGWSVWGVLYQQFSSQITLQLSIN